MRTCKKCQEVKELDQYYKCKRSTGGHVPVCKKCRLAQVKAQKEGDKERISKQRAAHYLTVKDERKAYYEKNKRAIMIRQEKYVKARKAKDPAFHMVYNMRRRMHKVLNGTSKCASQLELLGCSPQYYRDHLEAQFTDGMTWDNYGEWHQDHIQPCASFDQTDPEQQKICWHYTNFQPLWAEDNIRKSDQVVAEHQINLL